MAGNKNHYKKSSGGKTGTSGKVNTRQKKPAHSGNAGKKSNNETNGFLFKNEVILLAVLAVSIVLFLGNFGLAGGIESGGNWVSNRMRGLIGITEYVFPVILFVSTCFCIIRRNKQTYVKTAVVYLMMLVIAAVVQLLRGNQFEHLFEQGKNFVLSGGLLGGGIAKLLHSVLGFWGAMAILILVLLGCVVYLAEVSLVHGVETQSKRVYETTKEDMRRRREAHEERNRQRDIERQHTEALERRMEEPELSEDERRRYREELKRREEAMEAQRIKKAKIAKQKAYMEQDMREREARAQQYEKKEYVNANGMSIVTLEQPKQNKKIDESQNDVHEIFADGIDEGGETSAVYQETGNRSQGAFTIHRDGEISEVQVNGQEPPKITKQDSKNVPEPVKEKERAVFNGAENTPPASHSEEELHQNGHSHIDTSGSRETTRPYEKPALSLLKKSSKSVTESDEELTRTGMKLQQTLQSFGVRVIVTNISCGPSVTRYELQPEQGVKVSKIVNLADDIKLNLAVSDIRIEAPIPGKAAVGIEVPNKKKSAVLIGDLLDSPEFKKSSSLLSFAVGKDIAGKVIVHDVAKMPHLLVAGATGSGKSVCVNTLIMSILYKAEPDKVKFIMIDPKQVELSIYNGIPHMFIPVVTDPKKAAGALQWAVSEMSDRYNKMAEMGAKNLAGYNEKLRQLPDSDEKPPYLPQIVIIVDELADLMMVSKNEVEDAICRLAQLARAAGIHLVLATQRPSVDVITGLIKANMPSRIALSVSSSVDSRTIIDSSGAEKLLGKGDMLFYPSDYPKPVRIQGGYLSDDEVSNVVEALRAQSQGVVYNTEVEERINQMQKVTADTSSASDEPGSMYDEYFVEAGKFIIEKDKGSIGMLQRMFRIGFNRAARIMDQLEEAGVVGAEEGTKPRRVIMSMEQFEQFVEEYV